MKKLEKLLEGITLGVRVVKESWDIIIHDHPCIGAMTEINMWSRYEPFAFIDSKEAEVFAQKKSEELLNWYGSLPRGEQLAQDEERGVLGESCRREYVLEYRSILLRDVVDGDRLYYSFKDLDVEIIV
jgi:hypothetical protein